MIGKRTFSEGERTRAVRAVFDQSDNHPSQWAAIRAVAGQIGCSAETLRGWVRQVEREGLLKSGPATYDRERIKMLERENKSLKKANRILREANSFFSRAAAPGRRSKH